MEDLITRLRKRAAIRRQIVDRKEPDRLADLLDEAADRLVVLEKFCPECGYARDWPGCTNLFHDAARSSSG
jgi:hypothetical protein